MKVSAPTHVSKTFSPRQLLEVVQAINSKDEILEIVNLNVEPIQYVCAGHVRSLMALRLVLDTTHATGCNIEDAFEKHAA